MRLVSYQQRRELYACQQCQVESLLLDCHYCERRGVHRLPDSGQGVARWACQRCRIIQHKCPNCNAGWVVDNAVSGASGSGFGCSHCSAHWGRADAITAGDN